MSQQNHGKNMDRPAPIPGSVRRPRLRAQAGLPREPLPSMNPDSPARNHGPTPLESSQAAAPETAGLAKPIPRSTGDFTASGNITRPVRTSQWPLPGPSISHPNIVASNPKHSSDEEPDKIPQRPPRPSNVPSITGEQQLQEPIPLLIARSSLPESPQDVRDSYNISSPAESSSRRTTSSVGSIPDFPVPGSTIPSGLPRRSAILGPPPSSRRGASSFYSNVSLVTPIPEESPRSRSHGSYASSAAMPEDWGAESPMASPGDSDVFFDDSVSDRSRDSVFDDSGDESRLVRSASVGKKGKPALVTTRSTTDIQAGPRPTPFPSQPFNGGTGYMDESTSSLNTLPTSKHTPATSPATSNQIGLTPDAILKAYAAASLSDPAESRAVAGSPRPPKRFSLLKRPPRLDIDAVRAAESRGSLTSLPDLIRRATRLAALIDKGKRPASRLDELGGFVNEKGGNRDGDGSLSADSTHHSDLSDMLAAFPPPVHTPRMNESPGSWNRVSTWPVAADQGQQSDSGSRDGDAQSSNGAKKKGRRCCGMPLWAVIVVVILQLSVVIAAIVVPLQLFVFKNLKRNKDSAGKDQSLEDCRKSLPCLNGGTNVVSPGMCSCICTNGFTGSNCSTSGSQGCTSTNLVTADGSTNIQNVTLGGAIPRLVADANTNFSIPLDGAVILARLNSGSLSCIAQNSLVAFDGKSTRTSQARIGAQDVGDGAKALLNAEKEDFPTISVITLIIPAGSSTSTRPQPSTTVETSTTTAPQASPITSTSTTQSTTAISRTPTPTPTPTPTGLFSVTDDVLDFARVVVLYILQEKGLDAAETAQTELRQLFSRTNLGDNPPDDRLTQEEAAKVPLGGDNSINLANFTVDVGQGPVGKKNA